MKNLIFTVCLLFFFSSVYGQKNPKIDSLQERLTQLKQRDTLRAETLIKLATLLYAGTEQERSFAYAAESKKISDSLNFKKGRMLNLVFAGQHNAQHGNYADALEEDLDALKLAEEMGDPAYIMKLQRNIGTVYQNTHSFENALKYYFNAKAIAGKNGMKTDLASIESNIGIVYHSRKEYDKALEYYSAALALCEEIKNKRTKSYVLNSIGRLYNDMAQKNSDKAGYEKAVDYYQQSLAIKREMGDKKGEANSLGNIGEVYNELGNYPMALKYFNEGLQIAIATDYQDWMREGYSGLSDIYFQMGDYKNAYQYYKKYVASRDSLESSATKEKMANLQGLYDTEKKDKEILLLHKENELSAEKLGRQNMVIAFGIAGFIIVIAFALFIYRGYKEKKRTSSIIEEKNKSIIDSITYARRIQSALLTSEKYIRAHCPDIFILYKPKDIVSGDFYWALQHGNCFYLATADSTGHGVPGAFMSMLGINFLNEVILEKNTGDPAEVLDLMRSEIISTLNPEGSTEESKDGMDCVLCVYDFSKPELSFAAANNPLWLVRDGKITEFAPDKMPVGKHGDVMKNFTKQKVELKKGDLIYTFTDGYADQFGGPAGKKFKYKQLQEKILEISSRPLNEQKEILDKTFADWKRGLEQIDDVLVIGVRI